MTDEYIKSRLGPCGLHCGKCFAFARGDIKELSVRLKESLGAFDAYAERFVEFLEEPVFASYPQFKEFLNYLSNGNCQGCRKEQCKVFKTCRVRDCCLQKQLDFCFQCGQFPCADTGFDEHLYKRYVDINSKMKQLGVSAYYEQVKDKSRY